MGIKRTTPQSVIDSLMASIPRIVTSEIVRAFSRLGEECIMKIRDRDGESSWFDQTGNLRSSIGYAVYADGFKAMESAFQQVLNGVEGASAGRRMIDELVTKYSETYALVVVAGMEYADYVEAKENKDVLATTELWAKQEVGRYLERALDRAQRKIEQLMQ